MCDTIVPARRRIARPRWGLLYGSTCSPLAALAVVEIAAPPAALRTVLRCVLALTAFTGMAVWVRASRAALDLRDWCACATDTITIRVIESRPPSVTPRPDPLRLAPVSPEQTCELIDR